MHRLCRRHLFCFPGLLLLMACWLSPAMGQDDAGESTWKIVAAPESGDESFVSPDASSVWEEPYAPPAPLARPAARPPLPSAANPAPAPFAPPSTAKAAPSPLPRPLIPSRQLAAANRGERLSAPLSEEQVRAALEYINSMASSQTSQARRRTPSVPSAQPDSRNGKPFQTLEGDPVISPWLNLDRSEDAVELPNYFTFVRPQFQQIETNRRAQADIQFLHREVQNVSTAVVRPQYGSGSLPPTGHTARFNDTAQFYGRWSR